MENQTCTKCHTEKPVTEFHHRGADYQRICKTCRKAHVPSGKKQVVVTQDPANYPAISERIQRLESRLRSKAVSYASGKMDADDIYSSMVEEILTKSSPTDSNARILTRGTWAAKRHIRNKQAYTMYVGEEFAMSTNIDGDGMEITVAYSASAEEHVIERETIKSINDCIGRLDESYQKVVKMLALGHSQHEIAAKFGLSDQAISATIKRIASELTDLGMQPA